MKYNIKILLVALVLSCSAITVQANTGQYVKKKFDLIVWVNVLDRDTGFTIELYKHETFQSTWKKSGHENIKKIILEKYNADKYSHRVILPGVCYVYYTETNDRGEKTHYLSSGGDMGEQFATAENVKREGGEVVEFGCVSK